MTSRRPRWIDIEVAGPDTCQVVQLDALGGTLERFTVRLDPHDACTRETVSRIARDPEDAEWAIGIIEDAWTELWLGSRVGALVDARIAALLVKQVGS